MGLDVAADPDLDALRRAGDARAQVLADLLEGHRARLLRMVDLRMNPVLRGRLGASDVLQEAWLDISARLGEYLAAPRMPFFLWVRFLTAQRLMALHRRHLRAKQRDARRQVPLAGFPAVTSVALADCLAAVQTTPTQAAVRAELRLQLAEAVARLAPADREVLCLRQFEELSNAEAAAELGIEPAAASKRYVRALKRLRRILEEDGLVPGGGGG